jgi:hypothetical protein
MPSSDGAGCVTVVRRGDSALPGARGGPQGQDAHGPHQDRRLRLCAGLVVLLEPPAPLPRVRREPVRARGTGGIGPEKVGHWQGPMLMTVITVIVVVMVAIAVGQKHPGNPDENDSDPVTSADHVSNALNPPVAAGDRRASPLPGRRRAGGGRAAACPAGAVGEHVGCRPSGKAQHGAGHAHRAADR